LDTSPIWTPIIAAPSGVDYVWKLCFYVGILQRIYLQLLLLFWQYSDCNNNSREIVHGHRC
jgi:hypothetical protein